MCHEVPVCRPGRRRCDSAIKAKNITRQLLTFGRKDELTPVFVDIPAMVDDTMDLLKQLLGENIEIDVQATPNVGRVYADRTQLEQALINLCLNSRDAMADSGRIGVTVRNAVIDAAMAGKNHGAAPGEYLVLEVSDTGCGIPAEHLDRVFDPFFTTKDVGKGTGLGLATVYSIAQRHQGFVAIESEAGRGTDVRMYFPAVDPGRLAEDPAQSTPDNLAGTETILLGEDDAIVRRLAAMVLEKAGYTVHLAATGTDAVTVFDRHADEIDALVLDVLMPGKNGREVYEHARETRPDIPVVFCSGYSREILKAEYHLSLPFGAFLPKPYDLAQLLAELRTVLDRAKEHTKPEDEAAFTRR